MKGTLLLVLAFSIGIHYVAGEDPVCTSKTTAELVTRTSPTNQLPQLWRFRFQAQAPVCAVSTYYCPQQCQGHLTFEFYYSDGTCTCPNNMAQSAIQPCMAPSGSPNAGMTFSACVCPTSKWCKRTNTCCSPQVDKRLDPTWFRFGGRCTNCLTSALTGDPHFVGFDGKPFEFNGWAGGIFNLISEQDHLVNALFDTFQQAGNTYMREIGFSFRNITRIRLASNAKTCGQNNNEQVPLVVSVNDHMAYETPTQNHTKVSNFVLNFAGNVSLDISYEPRQRDVIRLNAPGLSMLIVKLFGSCHLDVSFNRHINPLSDGLMHGIVGQTMLWGNGEQGEFEGDEADYLVSGLFAGDSTFNRFMVSGEFDEFYNRKKQLADLMVAKQGENKFTSQFVINGVQL